MSVTSGPRTTTVALPAPVDSPVGWLVTGATFVSTFTVFGVAYSFGAFFGPMAEEFGSDRGATALFFAITTFLYFGLGVVSGRVADIHGPRPVLIFGAVCMVVGLLATSRVSSIWVGYATYGLGVGIGVACAYVPMVAAVGGWFDRYRTTALGLAVAGIGVGTLTLAPAAEWLIDRYGWRQTYVIFAAAAAVLLGLAALGARRPQVATANAATPPPLGHMLRTSRSYWVLYASMLLISMALFVPFVFLADYLDTESVSGSAGWLVGLIGVSSVAGRLGLGALAARIPPLRLYQASHGVMGLSFLIWLAAGSSYPALMVFAVVMGAAYGGFIALAPAVTAEQFGTAGLGTMLGALYTSAGIGGLVGPPLTGRIIDAAGYSTALWLALGLGLAGFTVLFALRPPGNDVQDDVVD